MWGLGHLFFLNHIQYDKNKDGTINCHVLVLAVLVLHSSCGQRTKIKTLKAVRYWRSSHTVFTSEHSWRRTHSLKSAHLSVAAPESTSSSLLHKVTVETNASIIERIDVKVSEVLLYRNILIIEIQRGEDSCDSYSMRTAEGLRWVHTTVTLETSMRISVLCVRLRSILTWNILSLWFSSLLITSFLQIQNLHQSKAIENVTCLLIAEMWGCSSSL